jgi:carbonic anhydrase
VVLVHTRCDAVKGACDHVEMGNLTALLSKIQPAVYDEKTETENRNSNNDAFVEKESTIDVKKRYMPLLNAAPSYKEMLEAGAIKIVDGIHNITRDEVSFYEDMLIKKTLAFQSDVKKSNLKP